MTSLYETLGVSSTAQVSEIKKAFHRLALVHHPDKGGDPEKFKCIVEAYEILSDERKRNVYDQGGMEAVKSSFHPESSPAGPFPFPFFPFHFPSPFSSINSNTPSKKGPDRVVETHVTFEEIYTGGTRSVPFSRQKICPECQGQKGTNPIPCTKCNGKGVQIHVQRMGMGMIQHTMICSECKGAKTMIQNQCQPCSGQGTVSESVSVDIKWEPGTDQASFCFPGESDRSPHYLSPGDIHVVIKPFPHPLFQRHGPHLVMKQTISLVESLCGWERSITELNGTVIKVKIPENETTPPQSVRVWKGHGMIPEGNLYIHFQVEFPSSLSLSAQQSIRSVLSPSVGFQPDSKSSSCEVVSLPLASDLPVPV